MSESRTLKKPAMTGDPMLHCLHMLLGEAPDKTATLALLRDVRFVYVAESLCGRISSMESGQSDRARCLIDGIIDDDIKRLLASPALCEIVRCNLPDSTLLSLLERATDDEAADGWSPLGDVWRGANPPSDIGCHAPDGDNWRGPTLSSNLPIDNSLPASPIRPHGGLRAPPLSGHR
jgi:hypothetical protein